MVLHQLLLEFKESVTYVLLLLQLLRGCRVSQDQHLLLLHECKESTRHLPLLMLLCRASPHHLLLLLLKWMVYTILILQVQKVERRWRR